MAVGLDVPHVAKADMKIHAKPVSPAIVGGSIRIFDLLGVGIVGVGVYLFYVYFRHADLTWQYLPPILAGVLISGIIFQILGVYSGDFVFSKRLRIERVILAWAVSFAIILTIAFALKITGYYSRIWAVGWFVATSGFLIIARLAISSWVDRLARAGRFAQRTVIVGAGEQGQKLAAHLIQFGDIRTHIVGFIDDRKTRILMSGPNHNVIGDIDYLIELIRGNKIDQVFVALPWSAEDRQRQVVYKLAATPVRIRLAPDLIGFEFRDRSIDRVAELPMLQIHDHPISGWSYVGKYVEDLVLAALILLFVAPLMLFIALAIKLESPGPVFFRQKRHGFNYNPFEVWKFRTMYTNMADPDGATQTTKNDPRVTGVGQFLRKSSLDELPQLINVLRGDMSIVGPRPLPIGLTASGRRFEDVVDRYAARHRIKPGITGWAQVSGWRGETDTLEKIQRRVECDLHYIDNWSIWFDIVIIFRTFGALIKNENAY